MRRRDVTWETAAIYTGAVIGAGFASGRELMLFFVRYGPVGPLAALVAGALLGLAGAALVRIAHANGIRDYAAACRHLAGRLGSAIELVLSLFLFAGLAVMIAAGATIISLNTPLSYRVAEAVMAAITLLVVTFGARGLAVVNNWVVPYMAAVMILASFRVLGQTPQPLPAPLRTPALLPWSVLLYVAYNLMTGAAVLIALPKASSQQRARGAIIGGLTLGILAGVTSAALSVRAATVLDAPMPMLSLVRSLGSWGAAFYVPAIWAEIMTTAVADAFALAERLTPGRPGLGGAAVVILALPLANQGFARLVDQGYPLLGVAGLAVLALVSWRILRPKPRRA